MPPPVPEEHPLRILRELVDRALGEGPTATHSPTPRAIVRALVLQALFSIPDDHQLGEQLEHNRLYRWFIGLPEAGPGISIGELAAGRTQALATTPAATAVRHRLGSALRQAEAASLLAGTKFNIDEARLSALTDRRPPSLLLFAVFLLSGAAALVYQLIWQRVLFSIYGIDTASVTIVVTAFMLGLGAGSLIGGLLSRRAATASLALFAGFELGIGLFGFASLTLFNWVASFTLGVGHTMTFVITFLLVLVPTTLMGATLPLLVEYATRRTGNVGRSVANLYFANTLGAALGALAAVEFMLGSLGLAGSVRWAALLNIGLGIVVAALYALERRRRAPT